MAWYEATFVESGRAAALWMLVGFVLTFAATRWVTRRIRAGEAARARTGEPAPEGGVLSNIHIGGVHVHHQVWGILLVLVTGALHLRYAPGSPWAEVLGLLFGAGAALALDEFALWLHLEDVYWSEEGRKSIDAILVAVVIAAALLVQVNPIGISPDTAGSRWVFVLAVVAHFAWVVIAFLKGKRHLGLVGIVVPAVAMVCALRLAKPTSFWAHRFYSDARRERARRRFSEVYQARWDRLRDRIGGDHGKRLLAAGDRMVHEEIVHATVDEPPARPDRGPDAAR
ncbi:hypothetical protein [Demequina pelophila]|uniref:hypothetical protein n=1 Tax=Demequina pelophila TaxID=1638984 RepID=UPI000A7E9383|nr:hypothetical protein [Demequina pelophila]